MNTLILVATASMAGSIANLQIDSTDADRVRSFPAQVDAIERILGHADVAADLRTSRSDERAASIFDFRDVHRYQLVVPSGRIRYRDLANFTVNPKNPAELHTPRGDAAVRVAVELAQSLDREGLLTVDQLDVERAWTSEHMLDIDTGEALPPEVGGPFLIETIVRIQRTIDGIPVAGQGLRVWIGDRGAIHGFDVTWRGEIDGKTRITGDLEGARAALDEVKDPRGTTITEWEGLAYVDLDPERPLEAIEPAWLFVYRQESPGAPDVIGRPTNAVRAGKTQYRAFAASPSMLYNEMDLWGEVGDER